MWKKLLLCCCVVFLTCVAHVTFTNLKCNSTNRNVGEFDYCYIKAVNRSYKYFSLYYKLHERPLYNISLNIKILRKSNGYNQFFPNINIDICKFLINPKHPIMTIFYEMLKEFSNLNHTCPFIADIYIDKLHTRGFESDLNRYIPLPDGDYAICFHFQVKKVESCNVCLYFKVLK